MNGEDVTKIFKAAYDGKKSKNKAYATSYLKNVYGLPTVPTMNKRRQKHTVTYSNTPTGHSTPQQRAVNALIHH